MSGAVETIKVARDEAGMRLDRWFRVHFPDVGHVYLQKLLRTGQVRVDSRRVFGRRCADSRCLRGQRTGARRRGRSGASAGQGAGSPSAHAAPACGQAARGDGGRRRSR